MIIPVVLSGGSGTRLWPLSRAHYPKQLLALASENTMLQETYLRLEGLDMGAPTIVCNEDHRFMVAEQLRAIECNPQAIILEPIGRNTAPAIAIAAMAQENPDAILLVLPADHVIQNAESFRKVVEQGAALAQNGAMVTFGVVPRSPETGYGYIQGGEQVNEEAYKVAEFVEKPDLATAQSYLEAGSYYWNSGMFMFRADQYLAELEKQNAQMLACCDEAWQKSSRDLDFCRLDKESFTACPSDSIDYAVMEKTDQAVVLPLDAGWSDVGAWSSLWEVSEKDDAGNHFVGDVLQEQSQNNYVYARNRLVSLVGAEDMVVIDTDDAILVAAKDKVQDVKAIVNQLNAADRAETQLHRKVVRPWGSYDSIDADEGFQVKRITVNPGASLSLQKHFHRAEHWIVVSGTAEVTRGDEVFAVNKNESTYIPMGEVHRLRNPGKIPLKLIEVQSGDYLGEDDIVRMEDVYGRN